MDFVSGICGKDFVMVCTDSTAVHSIIRIKQDEDKIVPVDSHKVFAISGEAGDRVQFSEFIIANVKLYALRNSTELTTKSVAHYARNELAVALRKVRARRRRHDRRCARACMHARWAAGHAAEQLRPHCNALIPDC